MIMRRLLNISTVFVLGLVLLASSCKSTKDAAQNASTETQTSSTQEVSQSANQPSVLASIKRTPCYGRCPIYQLTIMDNGEVLYAGKRFVEKLGTYSGLLTSEDLKTILIKAKEANYFELEDSYDVPIADFPTCVTSVTKDGKTKRVMNKQGAPTSLKKFELYLDSLIEGLELKKVSDEVNY